MGKAIMMAVAFFCIPAAAGVSVHLAGEVTNETGQGIENARVSLKKHPSIVARTVANGAFTLSGTVDGAMSGSISDSLVVITRGFQTALQAVSGYDQTGITVVQTASHPWVPAQPLEYRGGMVKIMAKGHDFEMGQPCDTVRGSIMGFPTTDFEQPVHTVHFTYDFWMDTVEVTQGEYDSLMKNTYQGAYTRPTWNASNGLGAHWAAYSIEWGSAALFCNARSKHEGLPDTAYSYSGIAGDAGSLCTLQNVSTNLHANAYRLPTEAEWEYACRAGAVSDYFWGKDYEDYRSDPATADVDSHATWHDNSFGLGKDNVVHLGPGLDSLYYGAHEVGKKKPNAYGLYDMAGNVSEWCNDWADYYPWGSVTDPTGPAPSDVSGYTRAQRGGNWSSDITYLRSTERQFEAADYKYFFCGFRTVSSGFTSDIIRTGGFRHTMAPSLYLKSGTLYCDNAMGCTIGIFSLQGKKILSVTPRDRRFTYDTRALSKGSYIVNIRSSTSRCGIIHVLD
ncbi:MAG: SUMF1/EgtB/PvdO family nonheme iron enzyme [Chitinispirillaceae bacterium]|nr:SUMF1/EgtB/PvdO family nonheme iron enzyme [Chitinispirillaceae bacterium]